MRISTSDNYYHSFLECFLRDCQRHYCSKHRLLWIDCDTAVKGIDAEYANGKPHYVIEMGDCPQCEYDARLKKFKRIAEKIKTEAA